MDKEGIQNYDYNENIHLDYTMKDALSEMLCRLWIFSTLHVIM